MSGWLTQEHYNHYDKRFNKAVLAIREDPAPTCLNCTEQYWLWKNIALLIKTEE